MFVDLKNVENFYKVKITKKNSNHKNLRTDEIEGFCHELPKLDCNFVMFSEGLEMGVRIIKTTAIKDINGDEFKTENSTYVIEVSEDKVSLDEVEKFLNHNLKNNIPEN
jgi:hypothetical protein